MASERGSLERLGELALLGMSVAYMGLILWQWIDPEADPLALVGNLRAWLDERLERTESFARTFEDIKHLPEREDAA